jgi:hypothetical protein
MEEMVVRVGWSIGGASHWKAELTELTGLDKWTREGERGSAACVLLETKVVWEKLPWRRSTA